MCQEHENVNNPREHDQPAQQPPTGFDPQNPTAEMLVWAYCYGYFPMADPRSDQLEWFNPDQRGIIPLPDFKTPKSLRRTVRQGKFRITTDRAFEQVMRACAIPRDENNLPWINELLIRVYCELHRRGAAHSVEAWFHERLVGGLYGVHLGGAFFGESMFSKPEFGGRDSSKVCLVHLVAHLRKRGFLLLDTQFLNPHLMQFGCIEIPRETYLQHLGKALVQPATWGDMET